MIKKVLITGADGFIGSHLVEALVCAGYEVRAFVFYNSLNSWGWLDDCSSDIKNSIEVISGDIRDPFRVHMAMKGCDAVLHLAALIAIPYSYVSPDSYVDTNIKGTLNVVQAARDLGISKVSTLLPVRFTEQHFMFLLLKSIHCKVSHLILRAR